MNTELSGIGLGPFYRGPKRALCSLPCENEYLRLGICNPEESLYHNLTMLAP